VGNSNSLCEVGCIRGGTFADIKYSGGQGGAAGLEEHEAFFDARGSDEAKMAVPQIA
jgi:hypothetical protein